MTASAAAGFAASMAYQGRFCVRLSDFYGMTVVFFGKKIRYPAESAGYRIMLN